MSAIIHRCPLEGTSRTPCCGIPVLELPRGDRITTNPGTATCWTSDDPRIKGWSE